MSIFAQVVAPLILDSVLHSKPTLKKVSRTVQCVCFLSVFLVCLGVGFLFYAFYLRLTEAYPPLVAAAMVGGVCVGTGGLLAIILWTVVKYYQKKAVASLDIGSWLASVLPALESELGEPIRKYPKTAVAVAAIAGLLLAQKKR